MLHNFDGPYYMKNVVAVTFFHLFLIFYVIGTIKCMENGYSLDQELNSTSNGCSCSKFK